MLVTVCATVLSRDGFYDFTRAFLAKMFVWRVCPVCFATTAVARRASGKGT